MAATHHKNDLNAIVQGLFPNIPPPEYKYRSFGPGHEPTWQCTVHLDGVHIGTGWGINHQYASEGAAESAADYLRQQYPEAFRE